MKKLPVATQEFREIIERDLVYVDKTDLLAELTDFSAVFLSRPRRFGKSLLISTLEEIFNGNADLFTGLKIMDLTPKFEFKKYPVINLNMAIDSSSSKELKSLLLNKLKRIADTYDLSLASKNTGEALEILITKLSNKGTQKVVVLVDEYDYPVSHYLSNLTLAKDNSEVLSSFYVNLKTVQKHLRFVFVTGVTRYAMMGLSAALNNLKDISFIPQYASICGFTHEELDQYFSERYPDVLKALQIARSQSSPLVDPNQSARYMSQSATVHDLRQEILDWYDGYSWDGETKVLNPFSILNFFDEKDFNRYWMQTYGSFDYLAYSLNRFPLEFTQDKMEKMKSNRLSTSTVGQFKPGPILVHTGYLTIDSIYYEGKDKIYSLKTPNSEINNDFYTYLNVNLFSLMVSDKNKEFKSLEDAIVSQDDLKLTNIFSALYESFTAKLHTAIKDETLGLLNDRDEPTKELPAKEAFYHSLFLAYCLGMSLETRAEEPGSYGDPDLIIKLNSNTYAVMELKYAKDENQKPAEIEKILEQKAREALAAIAKKKYGQKYLHQGHNVVFVGIGVFGRGLVKTIIGEPFRNYLDVPSVPSKKKIRRTKPVSKRKIS